MERIGRCEQGIHLIHRRHVVEIAKEFCDVLPVVFLFASVLRFKLMFAGWKQSIRNRSYPSSEGKSGRLYV